MRHIRIIAAFLVGGACGLGGWISVRRPAPASGPTELTLQKAGASPSPSDFWNETRLKLSIAALDRDGSEAEHVDAMEELRKIPLAQIQWALETAAPRDAVELPEAAQVLLVRWGEADGRAAAEWAWHHFITNSAWRLASRQIVAAWAWRRPEELGAWVLAVDKIEVGGFPERKGDGIALDDGTMRMAAESIASVRPALAVKIMTRVLWSDRDSKLMDKFTTVSQMREAVAECGPIEPVREGTWGVVDDSLGRKLLERWRELDAEDFARSEYAGLIPPDHSAPPQKEWQEWLHAGAAERTEAAAKVLAAVTPEQLPAMRAKVAFAWLEVDPDGCLAFFESLPSDQRGPLLTGAYLPERARTDPGAALDALRQESPDARRSALPEAFSAWAKNNASGVVPPGLDRWPAERKAAWLELEAMRKAGER